MEKNHIWESYPHTKTRLLDFRSIFEAVRIYMIDSMIVLNAEDSSRINLENYPPPKNRLLIIFFDRFTFQVSINCLNWFIKITFNVKLGKKRWQFLSIWLLLDLRLRCSKIMVLIRDFLLECENYLTLTSLAHMNVLSRRIIDCHVK